MGKLSERFDGTRSGGHFSWRSLRTAGARVLGASMTVMTVTACGASAARTDGARDAGRAFLGAVAAADHAAACDLLAPETREQVVEDEKKACALALTDQRLPVDRADHAVEVYGRQAVFRAAGQTLFLSQFADGWKVVAAGCTPQGDKPYRCVVKGD
ncbi:hypothetical protein [Streptomyces sp. RerS4]|uniref:hypothetical protein n=1 Tax=Streptomyces sp. RerS4 TaxID=2942449 RepID=UPI00201C20CA|nr:hypothetical protein [Streptomyces sp. RerS4]UQX03792.1 hypothetical protein M4D82_27305 [Streptomyces sp. RerS4]